MEDTKEILQNENSQTEEIKKTHEHDLDLLGSNRGRFTSEKNEETQTPPKRGDGGDLL